MRLCMISLDAVANPDADRLLSLPALSALADGGVFCDQVKTVYPTLTYPIHASLLTGCYPSTHGIGHNQPFQPDKAPEMRAWYWSVGDIKAKTLHQAAREKRMDVASILWPVTGKNPYVRRNFPEVLPLPGESAVVKMVSYASPVWILRRCCAKSCTRASAPPMCSPCIWWTAIPCATGTAPTARKPTPLWSGWTRGWAASWRLSKKRGFWMKPSFASSATMGSRTRPTACCWTPS